MKRGLACSALVIFVVISAPTGASAQQQQVVQVSGTTPMGVAGQCFTEPTTSPGAVTFTRSSAEGPLTITYHISGGPTDLNSDEVAGADHTVDFADNEATATVIVHPAINAADATVTIVDGAAYNVGDPPSGTIQVARSEPQCATSTADTLARTGVRSTTGSLALVGITALTLGSLLLVLSSRRRAAT